MDGWDSMESELYSLGHILPEDLEKVGGKAANLSRLASAGFAVPKGYIIPVHIFNKFVERPQLRDRIGSILAAVDFDDDGELSAACKQIRELILDARIEALVRSEFGEQMAAMRPGSLWAVRSSAVEEDLAEASFAGQQDTYLNVRKENVPECVKRCWASYYNDRAVAYRHDAAIPQLGGGIAVIVQRMVDARSSGVMFTTDPLNRDAKHLLIDSSWGLGEAPVRDRGPRDLGHLQHRSRLDGGVLEDRRAHHRDRGHSLARSGRFEGVRHPGGHRGQECNQNIKNGTEGNPRRE